MNIVSDTRWLAFHGLRVFTSSVSCISAIRVASQLLSSYCHLHSTAQFKGRVILATKRCVSVTPDRNLLPRKSLVMPYRKKKNCWFISGMTWSYSRLILGVPYKTKHRRCRGTSQLCSWFLQALYPSRCSWRHHVRHSYLRTLNHLSKVIYEGRNFNSGNYLFTTDTK